MPTEVSSSICGFAGMISGVSTSIEAKNLPDFVLDIVTVFIFPLNFLWKTVLISVILITDIVSASKLNL